MVTQDASSVQVNLISDDLWMQLVLFMNNASSGSEYAVAGGYQMGYAQVTFPVAAEYFPFLPPGAPPTKTLVRTVYAPQGRSLSSDSVISDYSSNPLLVSDFLSGRYQLSVFSNPTSLTISPRLLDMNDGGAQVWALPPWSVNTLPKAVDAEIVGWGMGSSAAFTAGRFRTVFGATQSTVQSGPNQGQTIEPQALSVVAGDPTYTDPSSGSVFQYSLETGEGAPLTQSVTDVSQGFPSTTLQIDAVPQ